VALFGVVAAVSYAPRAAAVPRVEVLTHRAVRWQDAAVCRVHVKGLVVNRGPGLGGDIEVLLQVFDAPGGRLIGQGFGFSWLGVLREGESGPFAATTSPFSCSEEVGQIVFDISAVPAYVDRYRGLEVRGIATREVEGQTNLFGELVNTGPEFLNAADPNARVYVGFWSGEVLVDVIAARLPVFNIAGPTGQPHPPGFSYPWAANVPVEPFDRIDTWAKAPTYPPGVFPVPLGLRNVAVSVGETGLELVGSLYNCGVEPAEDIVVVLVARHEDGGVVQFAVGELKTGAPLDPGQSSRVMVVWPAARADVDPARVEAYPFAIQTQMVHSGLVPCTRQVDRAYVPWAPQRRRGERIRCALRTGMVVSSGWSVSDCGGLTARGGGSGADRLVQASVRERVGKAWHALWAGRNWRHLRHSFAYRRGRRFREGQRTGRRRGAVLHAFDGDALADRDDVAFGDGGTDGHTRAHRDAATDRNAGAAEASAYGPWTG